jgi:putative membrane protein
MSAYGDLDPAELTLRDQLAIDRTVLAYERTALGHLRTAAAALLAGITLIKLVDDATLVGVGVTLMIGGPASSAWGLWRIGRRAKRLSHLKP